MLAAAVPEGIRKSYERLCELYVQGILCYDLHTVVGDMARLLTEPALRERFLSFYDGTVTFTHVSGEREKTITVGSWEDLQTAIPSARVWRLRLRSGRDPIPFDGMLTSLLRWARAEGLLAGQGDRMRDRPRTWFRNYVAHGAGYHLRQPCLQLDLARVLARQAEQDGLAAGARGECLRQEGRERGVARLRLAEDDQLAPGFNGPRKFENRGAAWRVGGHVPRHTQRSLISQLMCLVGGLAPHLRVQPTPGLSHGLREDPEDKGTDNPGNGKDGDCPGRDPEAQRPESQHLTYRDKTRRCRPLKRRQAGPTGANLAMLIVDEPPGRGNTAGETRSPGCAHSGRSDRCSARHVACPVRLALQRTTTWSAAS